VTKKLTAGSEVDAYCTKCRLDLGHRIIAMHGEAIKKVECLTCRTHHLYRRPQSERDKAHATAATRRAERSSKTGTGSAAKRASSAARQEREQTQSWERAIAGQPTSAFKAYRISLNLGVGELVRHSKFGDGVVARVIDANKVEVLFKDGAKTMAQGQP